MSDLDLSLSENLAWQQVAARAAFPIEPGCHRSILFLASSNAETIVHDCQELYIDIDDLGCGILYAPLLAATHPFFHHAKRNDPDVLRSVYQSGAELVLRLVEDALRHGTDLIVPLSTGVSEIDRMLVERVMTAGYHCRFVEVRPRDLPVISGLPDKALNTEALGMLRSFRLEELATRGATEGEVHTEANSPHESSCRDSPSSGGGFRIVVPKAKESPDDPALLNDQPAAARISEVATVRSQSSPKGEGPELDPGHRERVALVEKILKICEE